MADSGILVNFPVVRQLREHTDGWDTEKQAINNPDSCLQLSALRLTSSKLETRGSISKLLCMNIFSSTAM